jgi:hypothetical protein
MPHHFEDANENSVIGFVMLLQPFSHRLPYYQIVKLWKNWSGKKALALFFS